MASVADTQEQIDRRIAETNAGIQSRRGERAYAPVRALCTSSYSTARLIHTSATYLTYATGSYAYTQVTPGGGTSFGRTGNKEERKAKGLLHKIIGKARYRVFKRDGYVEALGQISGIKYRLQPQSMIQIVSGKHSGSRLCIGTAEWVPGTDNLISQLLMVTGDEEKLWKQANYWPGGKPLGHWEKRL